METVTIGTGRRSDWMPSRAQVSSWYHLDRSPEGAPTYPCGCSLKLELASQVYPHLRSRPDIPGFGVRSDAFTTPGRATSRRRLVLAPDTPFQARGLEGPPCDSALALLSTADRSDARVEARFHQLQGVLADLHAHSPLRFGKGHSVAAGVDGLVLELLRHAPGPGHTAWNHDALITADSTLRPGAILSTLVAVSNALSDILLMGITDGLVVSPLLAGAPAVVSRVRTDLESVQTLFRRNGVPLEVEATEGLDWPTPLLGLTVRGHTRRRPPPFDGLAPGMELLMTRPLGEAAQVRQGGPGALSDHHLTALQEMATPDVCAAKVIADHLPMEDEAWDARRHVGFCTDITGPGLRVIEEAARAADVTVDIERLSLLGGFLPTLDGGHQSESTNGPLVVAAQPSVLGEVETAMQARGLDACWRLGRVRQRRGDVRVVVDRALSRLEGQDFEDDGFFTWERWAPMADGGPRREDLFESWSWHD